MKSIDQNFQSVLPTRTAFLKRHDLKPEDTTLVQVVYETNNFCRYRTLVDNDKGDGITRHPTIASDALVVTQPGHALLLPLADCVGAVMYDQTKHILMLSHLGRHNLEQHGGTKCVQYLISQHACNPHDIIVWLSPAASKEHYPLYAFENRSLHDVSIEQILAAGIPIENITTSPIDSAADKKYFSHSQFLKNNRDTDGRFCVVAVMRA